MTKPLRYEEIFPSGRTFYYEGNNRQEFIAQMYALGLEAVVTVTVEVPADKLDAFMKLGLPVGT